MPGKCVSDFSYHFKFSIDSQNKFKFALLITILGLVFKLNKTQTKILFKRNKPYYTYLKNFRLKKPVYY